MHRASIYICTVTAGLRPDCVYGCTPPARLALCRPLLGRCHACVAEMCACVSGRLLLLIAPQPREEPTSCVVVDVGTAVLGLWHRVAAAVAAVAAAAVAVAAVASVASVAAPGEHRVLQRPLRLPRLQLAPRLALDAVGFPASQLGWYLNVARGGGGRR